MMLSQAIKSRWMHLFISMYITLMLVFYPISRMYANEYETLPIQFEYACLMVIIGAVCNTGLFLSLTNWGLKHKKTTCGAVIFAALMNAILLLLTNGNPLYFASYEYWNTIRYLCFYGVLIVGAVLCFFVGGFQDESR